MQPDSNLHSPRRIPKAKGKRIGVMIRLTSEDHAELVETAAREHRSIANLALIRYQQGSEMTDGCKYHQPCHQ